LSQRIPQHFIDDLIGRADIVDIIGSRLTLAKAGREYKALCPFHAEKTPSFTVSPTKGFFHCFGCGAHGTALGFLMQHDSLEFVDAVETLADLCGVEVPRTTVAERAPTAPLYDLLKEADSVYRHALREAPQAVAYLKRRGIDGETAARFGIGYAPDAWDTLLVKLGTNAERLDKLRESGLIIRNEQGRQYDRFRDRIMFPIRDPRGRVIGFGGRVLDQSEPKYLNSPETPVFHKGQALYGLYEARQTQGRPVRILVVEGYLDVASLAQHGVEPVVATLGTATTVEHVRKLSRLADAVVFCFDGDRAGRAAAWRALETALPIAGGQTELRFLLLPEGHDPDSFVREHGRGPFERLIEDASPLSTFLVDELAGRVDLTSAEGQSRLVALAEPLLRRLPDGVYRDKLLEQLAGRVDMSPSRLADLLGISAADSLTAGRSEARRAPAPGGRSSLIRKALSLALHYPAAAASVGPATALQGVDQPGAALLAGVLEVTSQSPQISMAGLIERFRDDDQGRHLGRLATSPPIDEPEQAEAVLRDCIARILEAHWRSRHSTLVARGNDLTDAERAEEAELRGLLGAGAARARQQGG
jgi:DNA primase